MRDLLLPEERGENFDLQLNQLVNAKRVQTMAGEERILYRLAKAVPSPEPPQPVATPGPVKALDDAYHPAPTERVSLVTPGEDEQPAPRPTARRERAEQEQPMPKEAQDQQTRILDLLKEHGPLRSGEIGKKLKLQSPQSHLNKLAAQRKIAKEGNKHSPWVLLNGHGGHKAAPMPPEGRKAKVVAAREPDDVVGAVQVIVRALTKRRAVKDLDKKLHTLDTLAGIVGKSIGKVLHSIAADLKAAA